MMYDDYFMLKLKATLAGDPETAALAEEARAKAAECDEREGGGAPFMVAAFNLLEGDLSAAIASDMGVFTDVASAFVTILRNAVRHPLWAAYWYAQFESDEYESMDDSLAFVSEPRRPFPADRVLPGVEFSMGHLLDPCTRWKIVGGDRLLNLVEALPVGAPGPVRRFRWIEVADAIAKVRRDVADESLIDEAERNA